MLLIADTAHLAQNVKHRCITLCVTWIAQNVDTTMRGVLIEPRTVALVAECGKENTGHRVLDIVLNVKRG